MVADTVGKGEMTIRQAEKASGFSRSAIHRELSHRKEIPFSGTAVAPTVGAADDLTLPPFLKREPPSP